MSVNKRPSREYCVPVSYNAPPSMHNYIADRAAQQEISAAACFRQIIGEIMDGERFRAKGVTLSPEQEIVGLTRLCQAWREDCQRYSEGLRTIRTIAMRHYAASNFNSDCWREIIETVSSILAHDECSLVDDEQGEIAAPPDCETNGG